MFKGHLIRAATVFDDEGDSVLCCIRCGAYARHHPKALLSACGGPKTVQMKRQRGYFCTGKFPGAGDVNLGSMRRPTVSDLEWLTRAEAPNTARQGMGGVTSSTGHEPMQPSEILACFGLNSVDVLERWRCKVRERRDVENIMAEDAASEYEGSSDLE
eukprot:7475592-Karenia_brevis.AAC.1